MKQANKKDFTCTEYSSVTLNDLHPVDSGDAEFVLEGEGRDGLSDGLQAVHRC